MQNIFVEITETNAVAPGMSLSACSHNHALVHNPFSWAEAAEAEESEEAAE